MLNLLKKFVINRLLYVVLLVVLCLGIFPFCILFPFTMLIAEWLDKLSPSMKLASKIEWAWDVLGRPYDALVKMVG